MKKIWNWIQKYAIFLILIQAIAAMVGSLYLSEVEGFAPCILCWYQRMAMYSLVPILVIGLIRGDKKMYQYVFPIALIGWIIALYHTLLYIGIIKNEELCSTGISCTSKYIEYLGFITIPFLSLAGFSIILILAVLHRRWGRLSKA